MAADVGTVNQIARNYAADVRRIMPVYKALLYGSYAQGNATKYSDVDICFFLDSFNGKNKIDVMTDLLGLAAKYYKDAYIEPRAFRASELHNNNPFVKEVIRTGYEI